VVQRARDGVVWGFGMARSHAIGAAQSRFKELCAIASESTGASIVPVHAASYRELATGIRAGDVGIAWMPPIPALDLEDGGLAAPIVLPSRNDGTTYGAALVMRRAGGKTLADLQGLRVAWVGHESAAGYLVPRMHIASLGFDPRTFFAQESFEQSHLGVVDAVVSGRADVGATFCTIDPGTKRVINAGWTNAEGATLRQVEIVATIGPIPNDAIVCAARMPAGLKTGLTRWLLGPDARTHELLAELFQVRAFRVAPVAHFDPLRHLVRAARARGYDA
jgi:ABC-type phosphate/phosphonate transport system substrate-binding protein